MAIDRGDADDLDAAVLIALRSARQPRSGLAALLALEGRALGARLMALYLVPPRGRAELLASSGADAPALGAPGAAHGPVEPFLRHRAQQSEAGSCIEPPGAAPWHGYARVACSVTPLPDGTAVLLAASDTEIDADALARAAAPAALLATVLHADNRVRSAEGELRRMRQERALLAAGLQHDLRTPLTSILGSAQTLIDRGDVLPDHQRTELLGVVAAQASRLNVMITETLSHQATGPDAPEQLFPIDVTALAERVAAAARAGNGGRVIVEVDPCTIVSDQGRLERALLNLVDNALRYAPSGSAVYLTGSRTSDGYCITVADEGPGVAPEVLPTLFAPYATDRSRSDGTGLGLHNASSLVGELGGHLSHARREGWTRFSVLLPQPAPDEQERAPSEAEAP